LALQQTIGEDFMPLLVCPDCGGKVSDAATNCPHCGRPINFPAPAPAAPANRKSSFGRVLRGIVLTVIALVIVVAIVANLKPNTGAQDKEPQFEVHRSLYTLEIHNKGSPEIVGKRMDISINGDVLGYKATAIVPAVGESVTIALRDFIKDDERFEPDAKAVTTVWLGITGSKPGPDYSAAFRFE
jgi:hypothetical protein